MNRSKKYADERKPNTREYILDAFHIHEILGQAKLVYNGGKQIDCCLGSRVEETDHKGVHGSFGDGGNVLYLDCKGDFMDLCTHL